MYKHTYTALAHSRLIAALNRNLLSARLLPVAPLRQFEESPDLASGLFVCVRSAFQPPRALPALPVGCGRVARRFRALQMRGFGTERTGGVAAPTLRIRDRPKPRRCGVRGCRSSERTAWARPGRNLLVPLSLPVATTSKTNPGFGRGFLLHPTLQRGVVLPGGESWVAGRMMTDQLLSDAAGVQGWHSGSDAPASSPVVPKRP